MNETCTCGCCEGVEKSTPQTIANRPGLPALAYRVGTHATFMETMLARLSDLQMTGAEQTATRNPLLALKTRAMDDPAIAFLDAWATVADVLTFYQERIANEGYLFTATERRSILELAKLVGYVLRPGVAASAYLAFEMEKDQNNAKIPVGTRAQSIPGPGELPQSFETSEPLEARYVWNAITPRLTRPQVIKWDRRVLTRNSRLKVIFFFKGISTNLKANDPFLLVFDNRQVAFYIDTVEVQPIEDRTKVIRQLLSIDDFVMTVQETIDNFLELQNFGIEHDDRIAQQVVQILKQLKTDITSARSFAELTTLLKSALSAVKEIFRNLNFPAPQLKTWIRTIVAALNEILFRISSSSETGLPGISIFEKLQNLVAPLLRPPSLQPANPLRRPISVRASFSNQSDIGPQLLVAQRPELRRSLYEAWQSAAVTQPSAFKSIEAFRIQAVPFGHNAPLKPIFDNQRIIVGHEEWPLSTLTISIRLFSGSTAAVISALISGAIVAVIVISNDSREQSATVNITTAQNSYSVQIGAAVVNITVTRSATLPQIQQIDFVFSGLQRNPTIAVGRIDTSSNLAATIAGNRRVVIFREFVPYTTNGSKGTISYGGALAITDETTVPYSPEIQKILVLDAIYDKITPGSWVLIKGPGRETITRVDEVQTVSKTDFGISAKVTLLRLKDAWLSNRDTLLSDLRTIVVYAQSETLELTEEPIEEDVQDNAIELNGLFDGLKSGRWVIISGERTDITPGPQSDKVKAGELVMLTGTVQDADPDLPGDTPHSVIRLVNSLAYKYKRDTVTINANIVHATHGESRSEVFGSGDGSKTLQAFALKQSPLTYTAATTPAGSESSLQVRVNDILWHESDSLVGLNPTDRRYITQTDNDGKTMVVFGDGVQGSRLPTGVENVKAVYRTGIGKPGNVAAAQISLLTARPFGVKGVNNPQPATGGADPEDRDQARRNSPIHLKALDRAVSVQDYADFARAFAGIGKAHALRLSDGRRELVHLTIAGAGDIPIDPSSDLYRNLLQALHQFGDPTLPLQVDTRELKFLVISAQVKLLPDYLWEAVVPQIRAALLDAFSFERRDLGQDVLPSEVISTMQSVPGVDYIDLDDFTALSQDTIIAHLSDLNEFIEKNNFRDDRIVVDMARVNFTASGPIIRPAQLAYLTPAIPNTLVLTERTK